MFEKYAEEYGIENYEPCMYDDVKGWETDRKAREQSFKDGAEFGYNKLNEEFKICEQNADTYYDKLQKAKELLNEFMRISKASDEDFEHDYSELIAEAEQFISEVEKCGQ